MLQLALRNLFRHRGRTALTLGAIVSGVAALILSGGFVHDIFEQLGEAVIHSQSGHLQVSRAGFQERGARKPEQFLIPDAKPLAAKIASVSGVTDVMSRIGFSGLLNNGRTDLAVIGEGVEPDKETRLGTYTAVVAGRRLSDKDANGVMLGDGVAKALNLHPGDRATLMLSTEAGAMNTLDLEVVGVFRSYSKDYDARAIRIPLAAAHEILQTQGVNALVVLLARTADTDRVAAQLRSRVGRDGFEVWAWQQLNDFYEKTVSLYGRQFGVLRLIILLMVLLSVANSVNMSLFERVAEFGTMRALGDRRALVVRLVLTETFVLGLIGSAIAVVIGAALATGVSAVGIPMPPPPNADLGYTARIELVPGIVLGAFVIGVVATTLAGIPAALRVVRIPVVDALRQAI
jgi:putative ABC transport system permease protein